MAGQSGFVGSWMVTATDHDPPELSLGTFGADGTIVTSPQPVFPPFGQSPEPVYTSAGHGAWKSTGPNTSAGTFVVLTADREGNPLLTVTVHARLTLGDDGQSWSGEGFRSFADPTGNTIATQPAVVYSRRILAEAPDAVVEHTQAAATPIG